MFILFCGHIYLPVSIFLFFSDTLYFLSCGCAAVKSFQLLMFEIISISPFLKKDIFTAYRILFWIVLTFLSEISSCCSIVFSIAFFQWEFFCHPSIHSSVQKYIFSLWMLLKFFIFFLVLKILIMLSLGVVVFMLLALEVLGGGGGNLWI